MFLVKNKKNKIILNLFLQTNLVLGYKEYDTKTLKVFLNGISSPYRLKNFFKPTRPRYIKYKDIVKYKNKNTGSTYILSTSKGILPMKEAYKLNIGGILLFKIQ